MYSICAYVHIIIVNIPLKNWSIWIHEYNLIYTHPDYIYVCSCKHICTPTISSSVILRWVKAIVIGKQLEPNSHSIGNMPTSPPRESHTLATTILRDTQRLGPRSLANSKWKFRRKCTLTVTYCDILWTNASFRFQIFPEISYTEYIWFVWNIFRFRFPRNLEIFPYISRLARLALHFRRVKPLHHRMQSSPPGEAARGHAMISQMRGAKHEMWKHHG